MSRPTTARPRLGFWQIWNMSFGFLGIQFGFALQNANVSRIFETLGANVDEIPILWIAAPVTGLIVQPIIGYYSDRTWTRLGRRRPFFLAGAILASLALIIMPNSPVLWVAAGMLWIMDASINVSMEPFRAFVGDMLPSSQRTSGFAMQSFFIGVGAVVASALPYILTNWFGVSNTAAEGMIPDSVKWSFYLGAAAFFGAVLWTVARSREYSPEELESFEAAERNAIAEGDWPAEAAVTPADGRPSILRGAVVLATGLIASWLLAQASLEKELYVLSFGVAISGALIMLAGWLQSSGRTSSGLVQVWHDIRHMPSTMAQLAVVQFFSWFALFAMWIYTTNAVTSHVYGTSDTTSALYNEGADWVGVLFAMYNGFAALVAFLLPVLARRTSRRAVHAMSLVAGGLGLASMYVVTDPQWLLLSMVGVGIAWASILSMPYAILAGSLPARKMGLYMGIFNFFIVIPQIVAATILGFMTRHLFDGHAILSVVAGGVAMIVAAAFTMMVRDVDETVAMD